MKKISWLDITPERFMYLANDTDFRNTLFEENGGILYPYNLRELYNSRKGEESTYHFEDHEDSNQGNMYHLHQQEPMSLREYENAIVCLKTFSEQEKLPEYPVLESFLTWLGKADIILLGLLLQESYFTKLSQIPTLKDEEIILLKTITYEIQKTFISSIVSRNDFDPYAL